MRLQLKEFRQLHSDCPYTLDFNKYTEKGKNAEGFKVKKKKKRNNQYELKPQQKLL